MQTVLSHLSPTDMVAFARTSFVYKNMVHDYVARWDTREEMLLFWYAVFEGNAKTYHWLLRIEGSRLRTQCPPIINVALIAAAGKGYIDVIKLIFKRNVFIYVSKLLPAVASKAAMYGHINVLRWTWNTEDFHKPMVREMVMKNANRAAVRRKQWHVLSWISDNSDGW
jgi:hypothetical protein